jgi:23S rRNA pseudouridine1911/1915/1917 synthase
LSRTIIKTVSEEYDGKKVIDYLRKELNCSHRLIAKLKKEPEGITLNGEHIRTIDLIHTGDKLSITLPEDKAQSISVSTKMPLTVVYEDDDLLVVNKPPMLAVHESHNHLGDTLSNAVAYHLEKEGKSSVFRAVGRLDKGTSGLMVCALNRYAASKLSGKIYKEYLAVADGVFEGFGTINEPIYRPDPIITVRKVDERGEKAVTNWTALKNDGKTTLLRIKLETGRTHQIRVHFSHLGAALIGDTMYGEPDSRITHQALHCCYCRFVHPVTGETLEFEVEPPDDFLSVIPE